MDVKKIDIFSYVNYRSFLSDVIQEKLNQGISYRSLAKKANINSPNYFQLIIRGKRSISPITAKKIALGLELKKYEQEFFINLVKLNTAKGDHIRVKILSEQKSIIEKAKRVKIIDSSIHSHWLHCLVFELAGIRNFKLTPDQIWRWTKGLAKKDEIESSIKFLIDRGFLENSNVPDSYKQKRINFEPLNDVRRIEQQQCHLRFLELAKHRLNDDLADREFQALTIAIPRSKIETLKEQIRKFVFELNEQNSFSQEADIVFHVQCSAFIIASEPK